ncbi:MAG TPA: DUF1150 family protein [Kiloniellales bacterium]|nr:DUF1150 family protein [Kiloniellales bacterium]
MTRVDNTPEITTRDLMQLGLQQIAYIKPVLEGDQQVFAVHAADGTQMAVMASHAAAEAALRQHDLEPHSVH